MTESSKAVLQFDIAVDRDGFSLRAAGEFGPGITAVFGPSGAGKSTLLGSIAGTVTPAKGSIQLDERILFSSEPSTNLPPERRRVGFVYQDAALFPHMTAEKNIEYGYRLTPEKNRRLHPEQLAGLLGISHLLQRRPAELSGGERQRVALARTLATSPELLLLDEPMSALDVRLRGIVLGYLKAVHRELEMPMVYVSHSISEVMAIADSVLMLEHGKVLGFGSPRNLLNRVYAGGSDATQLVDNILEGTITEARTDGSAGKVSVGRAQFVVPTGQRGFGDHVVLTIGAGEIIIATEHVSGISARNVLPGRIASIDGEGTRRAVTVDCGTELIAEVTPAAIAELDLAPGKEVFLVIKSSSIAVLDAFKH